MSKALPACRSKLSLLDLIARETQSIVRKSRKFTAAGFLQPLLSSVVTGLASLSQLASDLKDRKHSRHGPPVPSRTRRHPLHRLPHDRPIRPHATALETALAARTNPGAPSMANVKAEIKRWENLL